MDNKNVISVREAAERLAMDRETLSRWLRCGNCPFGIFVPNESATRGAYYIFEDRLNIFLTGADMCRCPLEARRVGNL